MFGRGKEDDEPTVYVLRHTDGYDSNTVVMVSTSTDRLTAAIEQDPPDRVDFYVIETWENGEKTETREFTLDDWAEQDA